MLAAVGALLGCGDDASDVMPAVGIDKALLTTSAWTYEIIPPDGGIDVPVARNIRFEIGESLLAARETSPNGTVIHMWPVIGHTPFRMCTPEELRELGPLMQGYAGGCPLWPDRTHVEVNFASTFGLLGFPSPGVMPVSDTAAISVDATAGKIRIDAPYQVWVEEQADYRSVLLGIEITRQD